MPSRPNDCRIHPRIRSAACSFLLVSLYLCLVDCGQQGAPGQQSLSETVDSSALCGDICSKQSTCDNMVDEQTCVANCTNENAAITPKLRSDVVKLFNACVDGKDCRTVLNEDVFLSLTGKELRD